MSINDVEDVIIPETPKVIDSEQIVIYVPKASYNTYGAARFQDKYFRVVDGTVSMRDDIINQINFPLIKGDYENTIVQRTTEAGLTNRTWYDSNIALGENTWSGFKGYYFDKIYIASDGKSGQLSIYENGQPDKLIISSASLGISDGDLPITKNVEFTLICSDHFSLVGKVTAVEGNRISFTGHFEDFVARLKCQADLGHGIYSNNTYTIKNPEYDDYLFVPNSRAATGHQFTSRAGLAIGYGTTCAGNFGFTAGKNTWVMDAYGVALGSATYAGYAALSMGTNTRAKGKYTFAGNDGTQAIGKASFAVNFYTKTYGEYSAAFNVETEATGEGSFAVGYRTKAKGKYSFSSGSNTVASGLNAVAIGSETTASGANSFAEGLGRGTAFGLNFPMSKATGIASHVEGIATIATDEGAHAENFGTAASGKASHAGGLNSKASGYAAFAHTFFGEASGYYSAAFNEGTKATAQGQFVAGRYNKINPNALFIVGNGTSDTDRSNAFEVLKSGHIKLSDKQYGPSAPDYALPEGVIYHVHE